MVSSTSKEMTSGYSKFLFHAVMLSTILIGTSNSGYADYLPITPAGQKNLGSAAAYSLNCEKESLSPIGGARQILNAATVALSPDDALIVRRQFGISIHENKNFSPSRNEWFDFVIDEKNCDEITKPFLLFWTH
jgi:hypothetical protein